MRRSRQVTWAAFALALALGGQAPPLALAAPVRAPGASTSPDGPQLQIEAATTTYDGRAHTYRVRGQVRITLPQMGVTCGEATIHAAASEDRVLRVVFEGNVEARRGTDTFRAERITYHVPERRLVAEGATRTRIRLPAGAAGPLQGP